MTTNQCITPNIDDDHALYLTLKSLGLVHSQFDFGNLCGRSKTWYSSIRAKRFQLSVASLTLLSVALDRLADDANDARTQLAARRAHGLVKRHLEQRCVSISEKRS
jgi:hypothetical protein